jgi:poly-beta-1,6-N-acetyl-D-glucosamine synthase
MLVLLFWGLVALLFGCIWGYPLVLFVLSRFARVRVRTEGIAPSSVSIVIACYNEHVNLPLRLEYFLHQINPNIEREFILVSDGSTDQTNAIMQDYAARYPHLFRIIIQPVRCGKPSALNLAIPLAKHDIIVLSDARQHIVSGSVEALLQQFADPTIGGATSIMENNDAKTGEKSLMRSYINYMRTLESQIGSTVNAQGPLYAIRKTLFKPLPNDVILDDFFIPLCVQNAGFRLVACPEAVILDMDMHTFYRRYRAERIFIGLIQIIRQYGDMVAALSPQARFMLYAHKIWRFAVPILLVLIFITNASLLWQTFYGIPIYKISFFAQIALYAYGTWGIYTEKNNPVATFININIALANSLWIGYTTESFSVLWQK